MNLYELNHLIESFQFEIDEETGEILNLNELDNLELQRHEKIENLCLYVKNLKAMSDSLSNEVKNLQSRKNAVEKKIEGISNYVKEALEGNKFETSKVKVSYRRSKSLKVEDEETVIQKLIDINREECYKIDFSINKTNLKKLIQEGESIEGVELVEKTSMSIK